MHDDGAFKDWLLLAVTGDRMKILALFIVASLPALMVEGTPSAQAVEDGQLVKKDGKWEYYSGEDPGLKYLYLKGINTQQ